MDAPSDLGSPGAAPTPPPPEGRPGPRRLRRRPDDGHIAGVCAGVAEYFNVDPVIVRIAAVVLLFSGPGAFAYVLAWIFVPAEPGLARYGEPQPPIDQQGPGHPDLRDRAAGLGVSVIWGDWWAPARGWLFPLGLMALGAWLLLRPDRQDDDPPHRSPRAPGATGAADASRRRRRRLGDRVRHRPSAPLDDRGARPTRPTAEATTDRRRPDRRRRRGRPPTRPPSSPPPTPADGGDGWGSPPPTAPWDVPPPPVPGEPLAHVAGADHDRATAATGTATSSVLACSACCSSGPASPGSPGVGLTTGLAVGLVILGLGFVLGSFVGGSRALIFPALVVGLLLAVTAIIDIPFSGPIGEQHWSPDLAQRAARTPTR